MNNNSAFSILKDNLWWNNPVFIQVLGICSALAVTNNMTNTLTMGLGVTFVTGFSSLSVMPYFPSVPYTKIFQVRTKNWTFRCLP